MTNTWTTFASLTAPTLPELDANFAILSALTPIPCTVSGTNALTLTSTAGAATLSAYQNYMEFFGVAANTNNGAVTASVAGIASGSFLNVYKDTLSGPVLLIGGEIVQNCAFSLRYDATLNGNAGGFHLGGGGGTSIGQTVTLSALLAATVNVSGGIGAGSLSVSGPMNGASLSISGPVSFASLVMGGGDALVRLTSTLASITFPIVPPTSFSQVTISFAGCQLNDNIILGPPSLAASNVMLSAFVSAASSIVVKAQNLTTNATITLGSIGLRVTDMGFLT